MTRGVRTLAPDDTLTKAAKLMEEIDSGVVPVCDGQHLIGLVTDRDIVVRAIAHGRSADTTMLREVMSPNPYWCYDDQPLDEVLDQMRDAQVRRMPVLDRNKQLVGILTLGDVAVRAQDIVAAGSALEEISEPVVQHLAGRP
ncbi:CBS domain-containing protein [uncultured Azohydromonas sp.]|jgi:FOG: CBS domain|uniref:CBS domain-containing protein n=1 Tax=uncultured Azohydromonas sp. TaxID=487342 RepID=UPI00262E7BC6|nr:CBS domain-containing protein [uncultured Azohydromonas sp.]